MVKNALRGLVELLIEQDIKVTVGIVEEVLHEAAVEEVAVDVQLLMPVDHVFIFNRVGWVAHVASLDTGRHLLVIDRLLPLHWHLGGCVLRQYWHAFDLADIAACLRVERLVVCLSLALDALALFGFFAFFRTVTFLCVICQDGTLLRRL